MGWTTTTTFRVGAGKEALRIEAFREAKKKGKYENHDRTSFSSEVETFSTYHLLSRLFPEESISLIWEFFAGFERS